MRTAGEQVSGEDEIIVITITKGSAEEKSSIYKMNAQRCRHIERSICGCSEYRCRCNRGCKCRHIYVNAEM